MVFEKLGVAITFWYYKNIILFWQCLRNDYVTVIQKRIHIIVAYLQADMEKYFILLNQCA